MSQFCFTDLSEDQRRLLIDAVWMRQRKFVAGDRMFREYGKLLDDLRVGYEDYVPGKYR
tara:strand:+ start:146 stop:322 length:177 start_codon:yes stop_codon:yes gene_type:complete